MLKHRFSCAQVTVPLCDAIRSHDNLSTPFQHISTPFQRVSTPFPRVSTPFPQVSHLLIKDWRRIKGKSMVQWMNLHRNNSIINVPIHFSRFFCIKPTLRWILNLPKFWMPFFSGQSLLLSTTILNDTPKSCINTVSLHVYIMIKQ